MKVEILKSDDGVQINLENEDGSKTVWLCDTEQVAIFKLANLLFSASENPKDSKRSILVGDFEKPADKKPLSERAEKVAKDLEGAGLSKKSGEQESDGELNSEQFLELIKKMQPQPAIYTEPAVMPYPYPYPNIKVYPASVPFKVPQMPYIGDLPLEYGYPQVDVTNVCSGGASGAAGVGGATTFTSAGTLHEYQLSSNLNANGQVATVFKVTMNPTDFE